jgi:hypothetical protein
MKTQTTGCKRKREKNAYNSINSMTKKEIDFMIDFMLNNYIPHQKDKRYIDIGSRGYKCNLVPTMNGWKPKNFQIDCNRARKGLGKVLVHTIWWRFMNNYDLIPTDGSRELSHLDTKSKFIMCVLESHDLNESRKACHKFGWYKQLIGEDRARCPHWEHPCTGPLIKNVHYYE